MKPVVTRTPISITIPNSLVTRIDEYAKAVAVHGAVNRSRVMEAALVIGLVRLEKALKKTSDGGQQ